MQIYFAKNRFRLGCYALGWAVLLALAVPLSGQSVQYKGFTFDASRAPSAADAASIETALQTQVDMICSVGLPTKFLDFFKTVPIEIVPLSGVFSLEPGLYSGTEKNVQVSTNLVTIGHKPVLLHEMLHAYHDQEIEGGFQNPTIIGLYNQAKGINAYALNSHMMSNQREFFACSGTTYLFGSTIQEPFKRGKVVNAQPELIQFFKELFGPDAGSYQGSLQ
jgi:hypothetical protein